MTIKEKVSNAIMGLGLHGLDMLTNAKYSGEYEAFFKSYGNNILLPAGFYFLYKNVFNQSKIASAGFVFSSCSAFEILQAITSEGTFDLKDFTAYAAGVALAFGVDSVINQIMSRKRGSNINATQS